MNGTDLNPTSLVHFTLFHMGPDMYIVWRKAFFRNYEAKPLPCAPCLCLRVQSVRHVVK